MTKDLTESDLGMVLEKAEKYFLNKLFPVFPAVYPFLNMACYLDDYLGAKNGRHASGFLAICKA